MNVLVVDVGGTHVKILATDQETPREFASGPSLMTEEMISRVLKAGEDWKYEAVSIGYPGAVLRGPGVEAGGEKEMAALFGVSGGRLRLTDARGATLIDQGGDLPDHHAALEVVLACLGGHRPELNLSAVGHRVVQGGSHYREPRRFTPELIAILQGLVPIAPDHLPQAIQAIQAAVRAYPNLPQVICFDTAFDRRMPRIAQIYPLPRRLVDEGAVRYGFHGLSYEYIIQELRAVAPEEAEGRVLIAHLGNGASMAAVRGGIGVDTTMGFTPAGGLMMGNRPGDLDPGVLLYLLAERG